MQDNAVQDPNRPLKKAVRGGIWNALSSTTILYALEYLIHDRQIPFDHTNALKWTALAGGACALNYGYRTFDALRLQQRLHRDDAAEESSALAALKHGLAGAASWGFTFNAIDKVQGARYLSSPLSIAFGAIFGAFDGYAGYRMAKSYNHDLTLINQSRDFQSRLGAARTRKDPAGVAIA